MTESPQELLVVARRDLRTRLKTKLEFAVEPPFPAKYIVVMRWQIRCYSYPLFRDDYNAAELSMQKWIDLRRWLHKVDFSHHWLKVGLSLDDPAILEFQVCKML